MRRPFGYHPRLRAVVVLVVLGFAAYAIGQTYGWW